MKEEKYLELKYKLKYLYHIDIDNVNSHLKVLQNQLPPDDTILFDMLFFIALKNTPLHLIELTSYLNPAYKSDSHFNTFNVFDYNQLMKNSYFKHCFNHSFHYFLNDIHDEKIANQTSDLKYPLPIGGTSEVAYDQGGFYGCDVPEKYEGAKNVECPSSKYPSHLGPSWTGYYKRYNEKRDEHPKPYSHKFIDELASYHTCKNGDSTSIKLSCSKHAHNWVSLLISKREFSALDNTFKITSNSKSIRNLNSLSNKYQNAIECATTVSNSYNNKANTFIMNYYIEQYFGSSILKLYSNLVDKPSHDIPTDTPTPTSLQTLIEYAENQKRICYRYWSDMPKSDIITQTIFSLPPFIRDGVLETTLATYESCYNFILTNTDEPLPLDNLDDDISKLNDSLHIIDSLKMVQCYLLPLIETLYLYIISSYFKMINDKVSRTDTDANSDSYIDTAQILTSYHNYLNAKNNIYFLTHAKFEYFSNYKNLSEYFSCNITQELFHGASLNRPCDLPLKFFKESKDNCIEEIKARLNTTKDIRSDEEPICTEEKNAHSNTQKDNRSDKELIFKYMNCDKGFSFDNHIQEFCSSNRLLNEVNSDKINDKYYNSEINYIQNFLKLIT